MLYSFKGHIWLGISPSNFKIRMLNPDRLPIQLGTVPVNLFSPRSIVTKEEQLENACVIGPLKLFWFKWTWLRNDKLKQDGTKPERLLSERSKKLRSWSLQSSTWIGPSKWFENMTIPLKLDMFPIHLGSLPDMWLLLTSNILKWRVDKLFGSFPSNWLLSYAKYCKLG